MTFIEQILSDKVFLWGLIYMKVTELISGEFFLYEWLEDILNYYVRHWNKSDIFISPEIYMITLATQKWKQINISHDFSYLKLKTSDFRIIDVWDEILKRHDWLFTSALKQDALKAFLKIKFIVKMFQFLSILSTI